MTGTVFGAEYAIVYDELYREKDYQGECALIERMFRDYARGEVRRVLDLGCGTGGHAVPLSERGFQMVGVDRSPEMLRHAWDRGSGARFELGDITDVRLNERFDAVLIMFAVLGYQVCNADVQAALATAREHVDNGGVLIGDVWYGPAVLAQRPSERVKVVDTPGGGQVIRVALSELDTARNVCKVRYRLWRIEGQRVSGTVAEEHTMRYFFAPELALFLDSSGFELLRLGAFPNFDDDASEHTWNVAFVARAV